MRKRCSFSVKLTALITLLSVISFIILVISGVRLYCQTQKESTVVSEKQLTGTEETTTFETENLSDADIENKTSNSNKKIINVPCFCQYPELPTGCEATAAAMLLNYYGEKVTPARFASKWLTCSQDFYKINNINYGPDPDQVFAGDPFSKSSYGCYATPVVTAINNNSKLLRAQKITNITLEKLCQEYIDKDIPVLVWATSDMKASKSGKCWQTPDGSSFTWISGEHCLVLVGYNEKSYFFCDPQKGSIVSYNKAISEKRFIELGSQAVFVKKHTASGN